MPLARFAFATLLTLSLSAQSTTKLDWFRHDKFGMFIHWGPYSLLAGEYKGLRIPPGDEAEWIMQRFNIPVAEYRQIARSFNPVHFDAARYARLARAAGMRYLVLTAKHHDGFAMYHSKVSPYNIVDWTPFKRDIAAELAAACKAEGIRFSVYYSHREDWDHPGGYGNHWDYDPAKKDFEQYLAEKSLPQLRELLTSYGPLGLIWFDRGIDTTAQARRFIDLVHQLQPQTLINGRVGNYAHELLGDYQNMNDNGMPALGLDEYWETPQTLNGTWGYSKFDHDWKTPATVIRRLVEIVSKGGNYLLNIGPMADGAIPAPSVAVLESVGAWMKLNADSIYGATACPLPAQSWGRCTAKANRLFLHVFDRPAAGAVYLTGLRNKPLSAHLLSNPNTKLALSTHDGTAAVHLPAALPLDPAATVIALDLDGPPQIDLRPITQGSDSPFHLDALSAQTEGAAMRRFNRDGRFHIGRWTNPEDAISWNLTVSQPGRYRLKIRYAARPESAGRLFALHLGAQHSDHPVQPTGDWYEYKTFDLGPIALPAKGPLKITLRPASKGRPNLMYFDSLTLEPETVSGRLGRLD